jgi:HPt (histidine-containing phosphotransfer) domain-containing protein
MRCVRCWSAGCPSPYIVDDLPVLDRARLDLISRGKTALATEFLTDLIDEGQAIVTQLRSLSATDARTTVADLAHTLKGMAGEVGASRLRAAAAALEAEVQPQQWHELILNANAAIAELRLQTVAESVERGGIVD